MAEFQVRELTGTDAETIMPLMIQLGYELNIDDLKSRFDSILSVGGHTILGAEKAGLLAGFCHVFARPALEKPPEAVVQALVVDSNERKSGVGRLLMEAVENFAQEQGFKSVSLYSQMERKDAHAFYSSLGYELITTSGLLRKTLD